MQDEPRPLTDDEIGNVVEDTDVRPRLARTQVLSIRLSDDELRLIAEEARQTRMTVGAFIKRAALDTAQFARISTRLPVQFALSVEGVVYQGGESIAASSGGTIPTHVETSVMDGACVA
ncbi:MAG: ribbon-helix-helix protein, CopG family [Dehalococcoidia bacterium]